MEELKVVDEGTLARVNNYGLQLVITCCIKREY